MNRGTIGVARILGVELRLHPSWFFVFALVVIWLFTVEVPAVAPRVSAGGGLVLALVVALLFFGSVVVHELAHALVARRLGLPVNEITLFIFGGAAKLEQESPNARTEAIVAGVGPLSSIGVAAVFFAVWAIVGRTENEALQVVGGAAFELARINILLAAFNLVPGFPMDGGRLLRAVIWGVSQDFLRATRIATLIGRGFAYLLIALGFIIAIRIDVVSGIWLAFIGWVLNQAAETSYRRIAVEKLIEGIRVGDVMDRDVPLVHPNLTLDTLVEQHFLTGRATLYPVVLDGVLVGTVDLGQVSRVPAPDRPVTRVTDVMTRLGEVATLLPSQPLWEAVTRFEEGGSAAIPVVDAENARQLVGVLTRDGVLRAIRARAQLGGERIRGVGEAA
ncbi:MAG TPA: site-2 protease family protein [Candidatus Limnocylindrales bacterium]|nr:site-2 protease family protein [Candidatus Limnocylindrales bacterium]